MMSFITIVLLLAIGTWFIYKNQEIKSAEKRYQKHQETAKILREISEQQKQKNRRDNK